MSNRQLPYQGYLDRESGNYLMKHNRMMTEEEAHLQNARKPRTGRH